MAGALINITDVGRAALVASGNTGTAARKIVEIGLSTAPFDATDRTLKKLPNELKRITTFGGENVAVDTIHVTLRDDTAAQYKLFGLGLYLDNGVLFGVYCQSAADGPIMEKSPAALLLLSADMQFTTINASQLIFGNANFTNPPATTERQGVVELATQAEVNAGADDLRAVTPKTAAARYAALSGAVFSGHIDAAANVDESDAQLNIKAASGANGRESKQRFYGTFGNNPDTGTRLVASIRAGFNGGTWGKEYLDFWLNTGVTNDAQKDSLQARALRLVAGGRALFNTTTDDGTNIAQFGGNVATRGVHTFGYGSTVGWATSDTTVAYFRSNGHVSLGSEAAAGFLDLVAGGGGTRVRVQPSGRVLFGTSSDDGSNLIQAAGDIASYGALRSSRFGQFGALVLSYANGTSAAPTAVSASSLIAGIVGRGYDGSAYRDVASISAVTDSAVSGTSSPGYLTFNTTPSGTVGTAERMRITSAGRVLFGKSDDDGSSLIQGNGTARFAGEVQSNSLNAFRAVYGKYGVFLRNDGGTAWLMQTASGDPYGGYNAFRPLLWNLSTGAVTIDDTGASTTFGGPLIVKNAKPFALRGEAGTQREMQFQTGTTARWKVFVDGSKEDGNGANTGTDFYIQALNDVGAYLWNALAIRRSTGRVILSQGADINVNLAINRGNGEGQILMGQNDGYFFANAAQSGWYSPTKGALRYDFATQNLFIGAANYAAWHAGNLAPLDVNKGGTLQSDVTFAAGKRLFLSEGSAAYPSLAFTNDGAPDTGLYHINDGTFAVTCNGFTTVRFTPTLTAFDRPVTGPTPATGDMSTLLANTEWVTSKIAAAAIGQIVMEPRTSARAGYLKANGALLNRADYPALWAYAQASGALVADAVWSSGNWGCFSSGNGNSTFRIPELRGEHLRCWDDGRGVDGSRTIGSWQDSQNRVHEHGGSASTVGDHAHGAWTDAQGWHAHGGATVGVGDHQHVSSFGESNMAQPWGNYANGQTGSHGGTDGDNPWPYTSPAGAHAHGIYGDGSHGHNVGIGGAGSHSHAIMVYADGGTETRVRTVALLAMIRAY